ncbi:MAG: hypothetical protein GWN67_17570 [Phycisphaerae bacterium]|nr:hypothetical protein [Phycisphaerae bacterium]NIP52912.1 hypothetical protein [Phycisphaerae bacterium]NIS51963.1 hypothetical protein [Phycisphaerae bacterium]NIU09477.1 hypothetical protein [Phycisphaerae bacterium]NIU58128.1 hypothetical protein [Phycisphaerae bacterium]
MDYKQINEHEIEIIPEETPVDKILETMARVSYESAKPPLSDFLELLDKESKEIDFSEFVRLNGSEVLNIDYVNQRQCKTKVRRTDDGKYVFNARLYEINGGKPEILLNKVKSTLDEAEKLPAFVKLEKSKKARQKRHGILGFLDILLELIDFFT